MVPLPLERKHKFCFLLVENTYIYIYCIIIRIMFKVFVSWWSSMLKILSVQHSCDFVVINDLMIKALILFRTSVVVMMSLPCTLKIMLQQCFGEGAGSTDIWPKFRHHRKVDSTTTLYIFFWCHLKLLQSLQRDLFVFVNLLSNYLPSLAYIIIITTQVRKYTCFFRLAELFTKTIQ